MKQAGLIFLVALSLIGLVWLRTDGFSPAIIDAPLFKESAPPPPDNEIFSQTFYYLSKGRQCFVFESADRKYVIKFFNRKYLELPWYSFLVKTENEKRAMRRHFYENSYEIAFREFGDEIAYLHLGPTKDLPNLILIDKGNRTHCLDLNRTPFVLQKKGIPLYEGLEAVFFNEGIDGLYREIDQFVSAVASRISKQIADADADIEHNWGYVDGHLFHLDPGRLFYDERLVDPNRLKDEWNTATRRFYKWLSKTHPEGAKYLKNQLPASLDISSNLPSSSNKCVAPGTISIFLNGYFRQAITSLSSTWENCL